MMNLPSHSAPENGMDEQLAGLRSGAPQAFEQIMRTHNQRLFRIARSILRDDGEAEDIVQEAYIKVFTSIDGFQGEETSFGAWLAKITTNLALSKLRQKKRNQELAARIFDEQAEQGGHLFGNEGSDAMSPEKQTAVTQIHKLLEREIDQLPDGFREVFVLRLIEQMSVLETSEALGLSPQTVKSRLHRARAKVQHSIKSQITAASLKVFPFAGARCDRITNTVLARLERSGMIKDTQKHH